MMMPQQYSTQKITPKNDPINPLNAVSNLKKAEDVFPEYTNKQIVEDNKFSLRPEPVVENKILSPP